MRIFSGRGERSVDGREMIHRLINKEERKVALAALGKGGRAVARALPKPRQLHEMHRSVRRSLVVAVELLVGLLVIGAVLVFVVYQRLERGNIDLSFLVPRIEQSINDQLSGMSVKIESAFVGKNSDGRGVFFRVRNLVLYDKKGEAIANSPLAAVGLSLEALLWGKIAPSQMVFIEPTLDATYSEAEGLALTYKSTGEGDIGFEGGGNIFRDIIAGMGQGSSERAQNTPLWRMQRVDFMKAVTAAFEEARNRQHTTSYLSQFGVRDAVIRFRQGQHELSWKVPDFVIDLRHNDGGSLIRGFGRLWVGDVSDQIPPWSLRFQTQQFDDTKDLRFDVGVREVTFQSLVRLVPALTHLQIADFPISGKLTATLNELGSLRDSFANIQLGSGSVAVPRRDANSVGFDGSELKLAYSHKGRKLHILPSPLQWGDSRMNLSGVIEPEASDGHATIWKFALKFNETQLAAPDFGLKAMFVEDAWATGYYAPEKDLISLDAFEVRAGNASIKINGSIEHASTEPIFILNGQLGNMPLALLKRLWPGFVAPDARQWIGDNLLEGRVASGSLAIDMPAAALRQLSAGGDVGPEMIKVDLQLGDVVVRYLPDLLPLNVPEAHLTISGRKLVVEMPRGRIEMPSGKLVRLSHGRFEIADMRQKEPVSEISFRAGGGAAAVLEYLDQPSLRYVRKAGLGSVAIDGDVSGSVRLRLPLIERLKLTDTAVKGSFRVIKVRTGNVFAGSSVEGGSIDIALTQNSIAADGGIVIKGIPAKLRWQRTFDDGEGGQPPLRFSAVLSSAERKTLGLALADRYLTGDVPVAVSVQTDETGVGAIQVRADLTGAAIDLGAVQWSKAAGAAAVLQFDVVQNQAGTVDLQHVSLVGQEFMLEGDMRLDGNSGAVASFAFPRVSYKLVNTMDLAGQRRDDGILAITARIKSLDGRTVLRPLIIAPDKGDDAPENVIAAFDHDLTADVDTIIGDQGATVKGAHIEAKRRKGVLEWLDFKGHIGDRALAAMRIEREEDGKRYLKAESYDAGSVFRLLGLYPNVEKGQLSLKIDLEPDDKRENSGTLWVKNFAVIGAPTSERDATRVDPFRDGLAGSTRAGVPPRAKALKSRVQFDQLKAPFSYGNGRFDLHDSFVNGPVIGATLRGNINFNEEHMKLTGTYVPLYGINSAVSDIPLLNELLIGRKGEGVFGVTFAIEGPTANPTMVVNPVSLLAPGMFRQIFDFANEQPAASGKGGARRKQPETAAPMLQ